MITAPAPTRRARRASTAPPPEAMEPLSEFFELLHAARFVVRVYSLGRRIVRTDATPHETASMVAIGRTPGVKRTVFTLEPPVIPPAREDGELLLSVAMLDLLMQTPWAGGVATQLGIEAMAYAEGALCLYSGAQYDEAAGEARLQEHAPDLLERVQQARAAVVTAAASGVTGGAFTLLCTALCDAVDEIKGLPDAPPVAGPVPAGVQLYVATEVAA